MWKIPTKEISYEDWKAERRKGIGGSDAAAIAGVNKWKSPMRVYLEKIGEIDSPEQNEAMYWGRVMEDLIAAEYKKRTERHVRRCNYILIHPEYEWMIANIDRVITDAKLGPGVLECKNVSEYRASEWKDDNVPAEVYTQLQHYLAVTGYGWGVIAALIGGNKFFTREFERDEEFIKNLIELEKDFWRRVEEKDPPPVDGSEDTDTVLNILYPEPIPDTAIELPADADTWIEEIEDLKIRIKELEEQKAEREQRLKAYLKDNEAGFTQKYRVFWKAVTSSRFDSKKFKEEQSALYEKYLKEQSYRRLTIKEG